jgi:hypothetical protein
MRRDVSAGDRWEWDIDLYRRRKKRKKRRRKMKGGIIKEVQYMI